MTIGCSKTSASIVARSSAPSDADVPADIAPRRGCRSRACRGRAQTIEERGEFVMVTVTGDLCIAAAESLFAAIHLGPTPNEEPCPCTP